MPERDEADPERDGTEPRQRIVRVRGSRRARLTPAPGTHAEPDERDRESPAAPTEGTGPNDDRMRREIPPHY
ncbi:hypothetical protein [Microbacterium capsulatum]|uniref:Uncharacterized protein n=1 Tax=Microbacterium capsulatum TaxID=3041921 RepID=A0ABU0XFA8_9MICO|nr:hypothetical protein [Microbacterium sp. ASV81]MDQ4213804.1 hypothetical protein [Microbacterium sp. ASV81]